jgi:hypothetical protein
MPRQLPPSLELPFPGAAGPDDLPMAHAKHRVKIAALKAKLAGDAEKLARLQTWHAGPAAWAAGQAGDWVHSAGGGACLRAATWRPKTTAVPGRAPPASIGWPYQGQLAGDRGGSFHTRQDADRAHPHLKGREPNLVNGPVWSAAHPGTAATDDVSTPGAGPIERTAQLAKSTALKVSPVYRTDRGARLPTPHSRQASHPIPRS